MATMRGVDMPGRKASEEERRQQILTAAHWVALRRGVDGVTVRAVADRARLSHGLVLFHFKRKEQLVVAVLDQVLAATLDLHIAEEGADGDPLERLRATLQGEIDRLSRNPREVRLFLEYWALGTRHAAIRALVGAGLERYRKALLPLTEEVLAAEPARFAGVTPQGLAAVAVSFIEGCAVQSMIDPARFQVETYLSAIRGMLGALTPVSSTTS